MSNDDDWDTRTCSNPECHRAIRERRGEFVLAVTTVHVRWFCDMECASRSLELRNDEIAASVGLRRRSGQ